VPAATTVEADAALRSRLSGRRIVIVTRNGVLREALAAQIRNAGGEVVALGASADGETRTPDAILIDAGTGDTPDLPAPADPYILSIVLVTPGARSHLADLKGAGFAGYLVKPLRQSSLADRILAGDSQPIDVEASDAAAPHSAPDNAKTGAGRLSVLLAEDNQINAMLTRELLRRRGLGVRVVKSGEEAIAALESERFDLVLTDIHMPGLDGIEATRRIREREEREERPRTPIVALTADALETGRWACQDAGMDGFLTKPVNPTELDAMLAQLFPTGDAANSRDAAA